MPRSETPADGPALVVVIAAWNGESTIGAQLDALSHEVVDGGFEVLVADNGSSDRTVEIAAGYGDRLRLRVIDASAQQGQTFARNAGARASSAPFIVFLDQDDVIEPKYLQTMRAALQTHNFVAARMSKERLNEGWVAKSRGLAQETGLNHSSSPWAYGCTLGVSRSMFDDLEGFDSTLYRSAEDIEFCRRAARHGYELHFEAEAVLQYRFPATLGGLFRQGRHYGIGQFVLDVRDPATAEGIPSLYRIAKGLLRSFDLLVLRRRMDSHGRGAFLLGRNVGYLTARLRHLAAVSGVVGPT